MAAKMAASFPIWPLTIFLIAISLLIHKETLESSGRFSLSTKILLSKIFINEKQNKMAATMTANVTKLG